MRKCVICTKRKVKRNTYFYCPKCYREFKDDIKSKAKWVVELRRLADRQRYSDKKFKWNVLLFDDYIWIGGRKIRAGQDYVWMGGKRVKVKELVEKQRQQEYLRDKYNLT